MHSRQTDAPARLDAILSLAAREVLGIDAGTAYRRLVVTGDGNPSAADALGRLAPGSLFAGTPARADDATAALAGLWLWHDFLDRSHALSQAVHTPTGSFWHAVMHRREGDFSNGKYWYAKCRNHPALALMTAPARSIVDASPAATDAAAVVKGGWDAFAFVDFAERVHGLPESEPSVKLAQALQRMEWDVLFAHTVGT